MSPLAPSPTTVLWNRHARRLRRGPLADRVRRALAGAFAQATTLSPASAAEARLAVARLEDGLLVVAGGDGSVNLALNSRLSLPPMALIPLGTANDLARALALPLRPEHAVFSAGGPLRAIDVLTVNGQRFCTTGGLGLPSHVARNANRVKRASWLASLLRHHLYSVVAGTQILGRRRLRRQVTVEWRCADTGVTRRLETEVYGLMVTNVGQVAGRLRLCDSAPDDGVFEICLLPANGRAGLLDLLVDLLRGAPASPARLPVLRARSARITGDRPLPFFGDGEILADGHQFDVGIEPGALRVAGSGQQAPA